MAIQRAQWLRGLAGAQNELSEYFSRHIGDLSTNSTIIFVQTHRIAERLHQYITDQPAWNPDSG